MESFRPSFPVQEIIDGVAAKLKDHVFEIVKTELSTHLKSITPQADLKGEFQNMASEVKTLITSLGEMKKCLDEQSSKIASLESKVASSDPAPSTPSSQDPTVLKSHLDHEFTKLNDQYTLQMNSLSTFKISMSRLLLYLQGLLAESVKDLSPLNSLRVELDQLNIFTDSIKGERLKKLEAKWAKKLDDSLKRKGPPFISEEAEDVSDAGPSETETEAEKLAKAKAFQEAKAKLIADEEFRLKGLQE